MTSPLARAAMRTVGEGKRDRGVEDGAVSERRDHREPPQHGEAKLRASLSYDDDDDDDDELRSKGVV